MKKLSIFWLFICIILLNSISVLSFSEIWIVQDKVPQAVVVIGKNATDFEKYAAEEFVKYIYQMTGAKLEIVTNENVDKKNLIVIGRSDTNPITSRLITRNKIRLESEYPGLDGFIISTVEDEGKQILVLGGSMDRGTLYAVYHLLEYYLGIGFFENGDQVPKMESVSIDEINYSHRPQFRLRVDQQGCAWGYTYRYWDLERFKVLIDWMAKKKYNAIWWNDPGRLGILKRIFKKNGLTYDKVAGSPTDWMTPEWEQYEMDILRDVAQYAMKRGVEVIGYCPVIPLPESFSKTNPNAKVLQVDYGGLLKFYYLHPSDPMFATLMRDGAIEFEKIVGKKIYWWGPTPYGGNAV